MIKLIEAKNYRCLKYTHQSLDRFQVLIGANASGKSTFLDVVSFISDIVSNGIDYAITNRSSNYLDLTFANKGGVIELALEAVLPKEITEKLGDKNLDTIRYEVRIGLNEETSEHEIFDESVILLQSVNGSIIKSANQGRLEFPEFSFDPDTILNQKYNKGTTRPAIKKKYNSNDNFYNETTPNYNKGGGWLPSFKLGRKKSALGNLPADESKFPASTWFKSYLTDGVQLFILDSQKIKLASPPGQSKKFKTDGSNLPWVIEELKKNPKKFEKWIQHIKTALPDISTIITTEREDDKHRYLKIKYDNGIEVPSWLVSDGTLRLLALTLPAYLPEFSGVFLIEEPENGIHPKAVETVYQSLSSVYNAQILLASHSPVILSLIDYKDILCFAKTEDGVTDIVSGDNHPKLKNWKGEVNLSLLYAGGILG
jgi:predicted ATPase